MMLYSSKELACCRMSLLNVLTLDCAVDLECNLRMVSHVKK